MTPAPASTNRNRRSATLANIPPPLGPPPPPPGGQPGFSHSPTFGGNSSPTTFAPPRASFSSSRASPIEQTRPRDRDEAWSDSAWRSIFDAALVKAQQAVQLDELQETTLAANLYAQAANDLARVIPMCTSEKKKQSMLAIQAIYLDRVNQLKETALAKSTQAPGSPVHTPEGSESNEADTNSSGYRYSTLSYQQDEPYQPYQPQQYHSQQYQHHYSPQLQYQQYQPHPLDQYQPPPQSPPLQAYQSTYQQQFQHQYQPQALPHPLVQHPPLQQPSPEPQQEKGFRFFGKKRSKTQPSAPQPPDLGQALLLQENYANAYGSSNGNASPYGHLQQQGGANSGLGFGSTPLSQPLALPPRTPSPPPIAVSPIYMASPPKQTQPQSPGTETKHQDQGTSSGKSSLRWPFGKKKSKSFSVSVETSTPFTPQQMGGAPAVPPVPFSSGPLSPVPILTAVQTPDQAFEPTPQAELLPASVSGPLQEPVQAQEPEPLSEPTPTPALEPMQQGLSDEVNPVNEFSAQSQTDWYVGDATPEDDFDNPDRYYDDEDEDVDPYYIADTKGRAQAFEGKDSGTSKNKDKGKGKSKDKGKEVVKDEPRKTIKRGASSYSQEQSFTPNFVRSQSEITAEAASVSQSIGSNVHAGHASQTNLGVTDADRNASSIHLTVDTHSLGAPSSIRDGILPGTTNSSAIELPHDSTLAHAEPESQVSTLSKSKSKRTWFGMKKKDKDKSDNKEKDKEKEKEKDKEKDKESDKAHNDRLDDVARLMDEAMFGGSSWKSSKDKHKAVPETVEPVVEPIVEPLPEVKLPELTPISPIDQSHEDQFPSRDSFSKAVDDAAYLQGSKTEYIEEEHPEIPEVPEVLEVPEVSEVAEATAPVEGTSEVPTVPEVPEAPETGAGPVTNDPTTGAGPDSKSIASNPPKRSKTRHFAIFKSKKNKDTEKEEEPLSRTVTIEDDKSVHSSNTRKSSVHSGDRRAAAEMAAALTVRQKEAKKRDSDEYVPYEYQEEVEGPLMERVEVPENREVIGFVMPLEEDVDYTMEDHEVSAIENWDSWVSQLETFERVLSDKGMKKEKTKKKEKKAKVLQDIQDSSPFTSAKANRSSIFGLGRSDTLRSRASTTIDLNAHSQESRPISMSTANLEEYSMSGQRTSFQSSRSGGSELPHQQFYGQQTKKRWWNPRRKETPSMYRVSNAFSMTDVDQEHHLNTLLTHGDEVKSSEDLTLDTELRSLPLVLTEPSTPAPGSTKENPVPDSEVVPTKPTPVAEKVSKPPTQEEDQEAEADVPIAPMPKVKSKSGKPKLLPISTPLAQLLKLESAEELWQYVQQAKTYATSRMNKGDKRSAAIALKRAQALEARWQEILLEMSSSEEDTDGLLEDDDDDDEESEESEKEVVAPVKNMKKAKVTTKAPVKEIVSEPIVLVSKPIPIEPVSPISPRSTAEPSPAASPSIASTAIAVPAPAPLPVVVAASNTTNVPINEADDDDDDEEESYAQRRRNMLQRSNSTPDKFSKYKVVKAANPSGGSLGPSLTLASLTEEETNEQGELLVHKAEKDGKLGPDAPFEELMQSTNVEHVKFYIQRLKTDTVAKARSGSKFAALEGMKNVKLLQQRLEELESQAEGGEEAEESQDKSEEKGEAQVVAEVKEE